MDTQHPASRRLALSRYIHARPDRVWACWTDREEVAQWWAPRGMTVAEARIDLRPGGAHHTVMRDASGRSFANHCLIEAAEAPRRLVFRIEGGDCADLAGTLATVTLAPEGEGTRLDILWDHPDEAMRDRHLAMGFQQGWGGMLDKLAAHAPVGADACPLGGRPAPEHGWLQRMVGDWSFESESGMVPGQEVARATGIERVRPLGAFWVVGESEGGVPGAGPGRWIISIGFDPRSRRFRGSFIGSMMPQAFVYDGALSEDAKVLTLDSEGPAMGGEGTARYRDLVELQDESHRTVTSLVEGADGAWETIMTARFARLG